MSQPSPALLRHWQNQQNEIDANKLRELRKLDLFNERTFYSAFVKDLLAAKKEIVIYCPFVSKYRSEYFRRTFKELQHRNIAIFIFTRPIEEHENIMRTEVQAALRDYESFGANISYLSGRIHEKVAIIDREILWEGSLNILSQRKSREMMRRIPDEISAKQVMAHLNINAKIAEGYKLQYERLYRNLMTNSDHSRLMRKKLFWTGLSAAIFSLWLLTNLREIMLALDSIAGLQRLFL